MHRLDSSMTGPRSRVLQRLALVLVSVGLIVFGPAHDLAAHAQPDDELRVEASTIYDVIADRSRIDVVSTFTLTNQRPDDVIDDRVRSYFFTSWIIAVPSSATDIRAASDGQALSLAVEPDPDSDGISFVTIALPYDLQFEQSVTLDVAYTIPGGAPRDEGYVARVNDSYLSFSVWTSGDPGLTDVTVLLPVGFRIDIQGNLAALTETVRDGRPVLEALAIADPTSFFGQVYGRNDAGLITELAAVPNGTATVRAWPDDREWADFVVETIEDGVPVLSRLTGLEWRAGDIEVIETVTPYLFGYGGWFNATTGLIEVGDALDRRIILHELSHAWFNNDLVAGRWIVEGLAEEFASRAIEATGGERPDPEPPDLADPVRVPLNDWLSPWTLPEDEAFVYETYHYNTSWWVMRNIADLIGMDRFADVLVAMRDDRLPYGTESERTIHPTEWVHFFDLVDAHLDDAEEHAALDALFADFVLSPADTSKLERRRETLIGYRALLERADDANGSSWTPPIAVRRALTTWQFDLADALITESSAMLELRDDARELADGIGVEIVSAEVAYEAAASIEELAAVTADQQRIVTELTNIEAERAQLVAAANDARVLVMFQAESLPEAGDEMQSLDASLTELAALRAEVEASAARLGVRVPPDPASMPTVSDAVDLAQARRVAVDALEGATERAGAADGVMERIGRLGRDPDDDLADARAAFEADRLDEVLAATERADARSADAASVGGSRALVAGGVTFVFLGAAVVFARVVFRRR